LINLVLLGETCNTYNVVIVKDSLD